MLTAWEKLTHWFDWSVASVSEPQPFYHARYPLHIVAYRVVVHYNYHDARTEIFPVGDYGVFQTNRYRAYADALKFYNKMRENIKQTPSR